jgi:tripeptide aminopeptidase
MQLLPIPGRSGEERAVADFITTQLVEAGVPRSQIQTDSANLRTPIRGQIGNLVLKLEGKAGGVRRLFSAHLDTVPICVGSRPVIRGNLIQSAVADLGIGADDRAGVAVVLHTALEILRRGLPHPPLTFCWFVQEETGLHGSRCVNRKLLGHPKFGFNWDGGSPAKLTVGATSGCRMAIEIRGLASHAGGAPEWGVSAITVAALAIADLHRRGWLGDVRKGRRRGTSNVGVIQGGEATNVVTDRVLIKAEARSHTPSFREQIVGQIARAFEAAAAAVKNAGGVAGTVQIERRLDYEAFRLAEDHPAVQAAGAAARSIGRQPEIAISNGGLDANWLFRHGIPAVSLGCGQLNQHMASEALDLNDFRDACRMALRLAAGIF